MRTLRLGFVLWLWTLPLTAWAHPAHPSTLVLNWELDGLKMTALLPIDQLALARQEDPAQYTRLTAAQETNLSSYLQQHVQARTTLGRQLPTEVGELSLVEVNAGPHLRALITVRSPFAPLLSTVDLDYDAILHRVASHKILVLNGAPRREAVSQPPSRTGPGDLQHVFRYQHTHARFTAQPSPQRALRACFAWFELGAKHIAKGADHLLFLLLLLLPAPFQAQRGQWSKPRTTATTLRQVAQVVTAFSLGHSLTLALGAFDLLHLPGPLIELCIALSLFAAGIQALRPILVGGEVIMGVLFGLIHGLAFADELGGYGFADLQLASALLSFNLGIEAVQLLLLLLLLPIWTSLCRKHYAAGLRAALAGTGLTFACMWALERWQAAAPYLPFH